MGALAGRRAVPASPRPIVFVRCEVVAAITAGTRWAARVWRFDAMIAALGEAARRGLAWLPPEAAHRAAILALKCLPPSPPASHDPRLAVEALGLRFPHPLGL